jgi:hypothetical protein
MIAKLIALGRFWYDFVVGDDWRVALTVVVALAATALLANGAHVSAWWVVPVAVALVLPLSIRRVARPRER